MFHIVLIQPEIPPNTGNIIRLCANTGATLHLVHPLGFQFDDKRLRRAGLDYHEYADVRHHKDLAAFLSKAPGRLFAIETSGKTCYSEIAFQTNDTFIFGAEDKGLTPAMIQQIQPVNVLVLPMRQGNRSINLSNCAAIVLFEAWRQQGFSYT